MISHTAAWRIPLPLGGRGYSEFAYRSCQHLEHLGKQAEGRIDGRRDGTDLDYVDGG